MYDYDEACPISMAASVLCERWTIQIVREMFFGSTRYSEIHKHIPNISPTLLRNRLRSLEEEGVIIRKCGEKANRYEYFLAPAGKALAPVLTEMGKWGMCFARDGMTDKQNTASGLVRDFAGGIKVDALPSGNTSIQINLTDVPESPEHYIHVQGDDVQVCDTDLGFDIDVRITSTLDVMTRVWYGEINIQSAIESGQMKVTAPPIYTRRIRSWLGISSFTTDNPRFDPP
jgi:DNA-binding HxlR family transcriptional regulator